MVDLVSDVLEIRHQKKEDNDLADVSSSGAFLISLMKDNPLIAKVCRNARK